MNEQQLLQKLYDCRSYAAWVRMSNPVKFIRLECLICRYAKRRNCSLLQSALELCGEDPEENICLVGCACLLKENNG